MGEAVLPDNDIVARGQGLAIRVTNRRLKRKKVFMYR